MEAHFYLVGDLRDIQVELSTRALVLDDNKNKSH